MHFVELLSFLTKHVPHSHLLEEAAAAAPKENGANDGAAAAAVGVGFDDLTIESAEAEAVNRLDPNETAGGALSPAGFVVVVVESPVLKRLDPKLIVGAVVGLAASAVESSLNRPLDPKLIEPELQAALD